MLRNSKANAGAKDVILGPMFLFHKIEGDHDRVQERNRGRLRTLIASNITARTVTFGVTTPEQKDWQCNA